VFAITGTTTAYLTRQVTFWLNLVYTDIMYWVLKIGMLVLGYQVLILLFAIPFGQFRFFWNYEKKILRWMGVMKKEPGGQKQEVGSEATNVKVAVFASGAGSNAQQLINYFRNHPRIKISLIICNKPGAGVLNIASRENIPVLQIEKEKFFRGNGYVDELREKQIDFIVLAGFLWKIPLSVLRAFPQKIVNIHPALLPGYGGKGMYGQFVHEAVIAARESESGISIHFVDEIYDHGKLIFQATCIVDPNDTPETLAKKIHALEHSHYPQIVEKVITEQH
jgi:formyltetrahydrofolate-dependent phosphoribosylglycinamide formyltransferase